MADDRTLPGWPKKKLIKDVRRHLAHYGIRPFCLSAWRTTWIWAEAIARSYWQTHWPLASEIASQYILLLLAEMKKSHMLNLPYRADTVLPAEAAVARCWIFKVPAFWRSASRLDRPSSGHAALRQSSMAEIQMATAKQLPFYPVHQPSPDQSS